MKKTTLFLAIALCTSTIALAQKGKSEQLDAMIQKGMTDWEIPGLVTVVVKDGETVFQKAYGVKNLESKAPVDEHTLFTMASTTKAIICQALGILVDQGKLNWTDKVREHLPYFNLSDAYLTEEAPCTGFAHAQSRNPTSRLALGRGQCFHQRDTTAICTFRKKLSGSGRV